MKRRDKLPSHLQPLLLTARAGFAVSASTKDSVFRAVLESAAPAIAATVSAAAVASTAATTASAAQASATSLGPVADAASAAGGSATGAWTATVTAWATGKVGAALVGILVGVAAGAGGHAVATSSNQQTLLASLPSATQRLPLALLAPVEVQPEAVDSALALPSQSAGTLPSAHDFGLASAGPSSLLPWRSAKAPDEDLADERILIDVARTAISRGDGAGAQQTLARHAREFPHGRLREEAEVLSIQALVMTGRQQEARLRADQFRRIHPQSLMRGAVEAAVGGSSEKNTSP